MREQKTSTPEYRPDNRQQREVKQVRERSSKGEVQSKKNQPQHRQKAQPAQRQNIKKSAPKQNGGNRQMLAHSGKRKG